MDVDLISIVRLCDDPILLFNIQGKIGIVHIVFISQFGPKAVHTLTSSNLSPDIRRRRGLLSQSGHICPSWTCIPSPGVRSVGICSIKPL